MEQMLLVSREDLYQAFMQFYLSKPSFEGLDADGVLRVQVDGIWSRLTDDVEVEA